MGNFLSAASADPSRPPPVGWLLSVAMPWLVLLLLVFAVYQLRSWYRLRHIPGPFAASVSQLWMVKYALSGRFHERLRDVSEKYGSLTLAISGLCPSDPCFSPTPFPFTRCRRQAPGSPADTRHVQGPLSALARTSCCRRTLTCSA